MEIYIKPNKKTVIEAMDKITINDVCEVYAAKEILEQVKNIKLLDTKNCKKKSFLVSIIDIIDAIDKKLPNNTIINVGEMDCVVCYHPKKKVNNTFLVILKVVFISVILFAGSATAIMSFHTDTQIPVVFKNFYYIFFNEKTDNTALINIPYSIGIISGIALFYNHFITKKITADPTPIEVEFATYEEDVTNTLIATLNKEKKGG